MRDSVLLGQGMTTLGSSFSVSQWIILPLSKAWNSFCRFTVKKFFLNSSFLIADFLLPSWKEKKIRFPNWGKIVRKTIASFSCSFGVRFHFSTRREVAKRSTVSLSFILLYSPETFQLFLNENVCIFGWTLKLPGVRWQFWDKQSLDYTTYCL